MRAKRILAPILFGGLILALSPAGNAEEVPGQAMTDEQKEMMAKWAKISAPGEPHKHLQRSVGKWTATMKIWTDPSAPPSESKGESTFKSIMDGRFVQQDYSGSLFGQPFHGMGIEGYDNYKKKYVATWIDSAGTAIMSMMGTCDDAGRACTFFGKMDEPLMEEPEKMVKSVSRWVNDDTIVFEMYDFLPGGKEFKVMEITYNRVK
jgi:hypothetical protein